MKKERILQLICIAIITLLVLILSSCATTHQQCSAYALLETK
jgi:hypothetical protein